MTMMNMKIDMSTIDITSDDHGMCVPMIVIKEEKISKTLRFYQVGEVITLEEKMPKQLMEIMAFLIKSKFKGTGTQIIEKMIEENLITTKQNPAVLFAFYARRLEGMGIVRS